MIIVYQVVDLLQVYFWVQEAVNSLYDFRDHYFERNDIEKAIHKTEELGTELNKVLAILDEHKGKYYS